MPLSLGSDSRLLFVSDILVVACVVVDLLSREMGGVNVSEFGDTKDLFILSKTSWV